MEDCDLELHIDEDDFSALLRRLRKKRRDVAGLFFPDTIQEIYRDCILRQKSP